MVLNRQPQLDVLRGVAILLVLGRHIYVCPKQMSIALNAITETICRIGWIGVDLFFVLSGYLIAGLLFKEHNERGTIHIGRFYIRRAFKILPPLWCLAAVTICAVLVQYLQHYSEVPDHATFWRQVLTFISPPLLFVQNYIQNPTSGLVWTLDITWSIAVEEHFYLALPAALFLSAGKDKRFRFVPWICLAVSASCLTLRFLTPEDFNTWKHIAPTHLRSDALMAGVLVSWLKHYRPEFFNALRAKSRVLIPMGIACLTPFAFVDLTNRYTFTFGFTQVYIGACLMLIGTSGTSAGSGTIGKIVAHIGTRSYSIYLWHVVSAWLACKILFGTLLNFTNWAAWIYIYAIGALALGYLSFAFVEQPALTLRQRLFPAARPTKQPH